MKTIVWNKKLELRDVWVAAVVALCLGCQKGSNSPAKIIESDRAKSSLVTTTLTASPPSSYLNTRSIVFNFTSNASDAKFICQFNTEERFDCVPPVSYSGLPDGDYDFQVYAVSPTMGTDNIGANHLWIIDTIPPTTQLASTVVSANSILFALSANKPSCTFICSLDGASAQPCTTPVSLQGVSPGPHVFKAQAIDRFTNVDPNGAEDKFELRPLLSTTLTSETPSVPYSNKNSIVFTFISNVANATFICTLGNAAPVTCTSPFTYSGLTDAAYTFKVQAQDSSGDTDSTGAIYSWTVETVPPVGKLSAVAATSTTLTIKWTSDKPTTTKLHWGLNTDLSHETPEDPALVTTHSAQITGLSGYTVYSLQPAGQDRATNEYRLSPVLLRTLH